MPGIIAGKETMNVKKNTPQRTAWTNKDYKSQDIEYYSTMPAVKIL